MSARAVVLGATLALAAFPAAGEEHYCLSAGGINWNMGVPQPADASRFEFWVDTATGEWRGRNVGSRAMYTDGGTLDIVSDGTAYRAHWVGIEDHGGFESLRIALTRDRMPFIRLDRDGFAEIGTCIPTGGRTFIDGREITP